ncbi:MAG: hypothetical protein R3229_05925 [Alphaproteobacteria bacterium]|nr:hypothetical protein [Alphaproteobacteria bacterium]
MDGENDGGDDGNGWKNIVLGVLAGALGIIVIKLAIKWINGEI